MAEVIAGTYEIKQRLGSGGGGVVYLARHIRLEKDVVLKADKRKLSTDEVLLRREVNTLKDLKHPYIPQVYDFFVENETVYTVIDFVPGESLDRPLKRHETFSQPQVIKWARQLLEALSYLHSPTHGDPPRGYVHSDIKPANLMKTPDGNICLIDFNIALAVGEENFIGMSIGYASPEHYGLDYSSFGSDTNAPTEADGLRGNVKTEAKDVSQVISGSQEGTHMDAPPGADEGGTRMDTPPGADEGGTRMDAPSNADEGGTRMDALPDADEGGTRMDAPPGADEGSTYMDRRPARLEVRQEGDADGATLPSQEEGGRMKPLQAGSTPPCPEPPAAEKAAPPQDPPSQKTTSKRRKIVPDVRSDIYSVGATLYHLLSGVRPARDAKDVIPLSTADFSPPLVAIITKAMNPNPDLRYQTADEMLEAFDRLFTDDPRVLRLKRQSKFAYAVLAAVFAVGIFTSFTGLKRGQTEESWLKSVEYSKNALAEGDKSSALGYALAAIPEKPGIFTPAALPSAQAALAEALGVYNLSDGYRSYDMIPLPSAPILTEMSPEGGSVACICANELLIFDTASRRQIASLETVGSALAEVKYLDEDTILYAGLDGLTAYDLKNGTMLWQGGKATAVSLSDDGTRVAAVYRDESFARVYSTADGALLATVDFGGRTQSVAANDTAANPHDNLFALNRDGTLLAASFSDGALLIFDLQDSDHSLICLDRSDFVHFEGGFYGRYLAYSAMGNGKSVFTAVNFDTAVQKGFDSTMPLLVQTDEAGIYVATENLLVQIDPESGEQKELAYTGADIVSYRREGSHIVTATADGGLSFFGPNGVLLTAFEEQAPSSFVDLGGNFASAGNLNDASLRLLALENHPEAQLFAYDPEYAHNEARLSADGQTVMLFRYDRFRLYNREGQVLTDVDLPDPAQVYDQQFRRDGSESWLEVTYNDGLIRNYSAKDGSLISEERGEAPDGSLHEEYFTDKLRIDAPLHGAPVAYRAKDGKQVAVLETDDYLTYVTQVGDLVVTEYTTAEGQRYGLLLNEKCETVSRLPNLCDVLNDGTLLFDDMLGNIRQGRIYSIDELLTLARN